MGLNVCVRLLPLLLVPYWNDGTLILPSGLPPSLSLDKKWIGWGLWKGGFKRQEQQRASLVPFARLIDVACFPNPWPKFFVSSFVNRRGSNNAPREGVRGSWEPCCRCTNLCGHQLSRRSPYVGVRGNRNSTSRDRAPNRNGPIRNVPIHAQAPLSPLSVGRVRIATGDDSSQVVQTTPPYTFGRTGIDKATVSLERPSPSFEI